MRTLFLIPARAGSKRLIGKNYKILGDLPLIAYTLLFAKDVANSEDEICVSTDDPKIIEIATKYGLKPPFLRPQELSSDSSGTYDVIMHALNYYSEQGISFDTVLLLQVTSPFRIKTDFEGVFDKLDGECDMVVSVSIAKQNPYTNLFEENEFGRLVQCKQVNDCNPPPVYCYNGSIYLIKVESLKTMNLQQFRKVNKYLMPEERSIDIDTMSDWLLAEQIIKVNK